MSPHLHNPRVCPPHPGVPMCPCILTWLCVPTCRCLPGVTVSLSPAHGWGGQVHLQVRDRPRPVGPQQPRHLPRQGGDQGGRGGHEGHGDRGRDTGTGVGAGWRWGHGQGEGGARDEGEAGDTGVDRTGTQVGLGTWVGSRTGNEVGDTDGDRGGDRKRVSGVGTRTGVCIQVMDRRSMGTWLGTEPGWGVA